MSLHAKAIAPVPEQTARVAQAAFPKGNPYLTLGDRLGQLFEDETFADLYPQRGQPAQTPWRLALITLLQFAEDLSDRQAADAVRARIDWKYALALDLDDPGFDASVLCEFRARLLAGEAERRLLDTLLDWCRKDQLLKAGGKQRTDSTHVLAAVRAINRVELVLETLRFALNSLAVATPDWLRQHARPEWAEQYARRAFDERLPKKEAEREALCRRVGADGFFLMERAFAPEAPEGLRHLPAVVVLRQVWVQNYLRTPDGPQWRDTDNIPPASLFLSSPYDEQAHLARKRTTCWVGYKVHLTETCDEDLPSLITHVETTAAPEVDGAVTERIHQSLQEAQLLPRTHIVDSGYLDADLMARSRRDYDVDLLGPTLANRHWQAREAGGFDQSRFRIDWDKRQATCPLGKQSTGWSPMKDRHGGRVIKVIFSTRDCAPCPSRDRCVRSGQKAIRRGLLLREREAYEALQAGRAREQTEEYQRDYRRRAGIEGSLSRAVRRCGLRRARYNGLVKVHLGNLLAAAALNLVRLVEWLDGTAKPKTRTSAFSRLMGQCSPAQPFRQQYRSQGRIRSRFGPRRTCRRERCSSSRPTTWRHASPSSARPAGPATRST